MAPEDLPPSCRLRRPRGSPDQRAIAVAEMQVSERPFVVLDLPHGGAEKCTKQKKGRYDAELGVRPNPKPQALRGLKQISQNNTLFRDRLIAAPPHTPHIFKLQ